LGRTFRFGGGFLTNMEKLGGKFSTYMENSLKKRVSWNLKGVKERKKFPV